jgi:hypothetical protein
VAQTWREHPQIKHLFRPGKPDSLPVLVHDGGPTVSDLRPEALLVTVSWEKNDVFTAAIEQAPRTVKSVGAADQIFFVMPSAGTKLPIRVTQAYIRELREWDIVPCPQCGMDHLFDCPSSLARKAGGGDAFDTPCPMCKTEMTVCKKPPEPKRAPSAPPPPEKKWWEVWK